MFEPVSSTALPLTDVVAAVGISLLLGIYVALIYHLVTPAATYSVSIQRTLMSLSMIVALVMLIISNQIARAFTLVGALAVIRFRTPVKDPKDAAFIFLSLAGGMGAGVGLYLQTALGTFMIGLLMALTHYLNFRYRGTREAILKFAVPLEGGEAALYHQKVFDRFLREYRLISTRSAPETGRLELTFLVRPQKPNDMIELSKGLSSIPQIKGVSVIVAEDDELTPRIF